jgi:hypothetical protein
MGSRLWSTLLPNPVDQHNVLAVQLDELPGEKKHRQKLRAEKWFIERRAEIPRDSDRNAIVELGGMS